MTYFRPSSAFFLGWRGLRQFGAKFMTSRAGECRRWSGAGLSGGNACKMTVAIDIGVGPEGVYTKE
jgi:hypothetical protein